MLNTDKDAAHAGDGEKSNPWAAAARRLAKETDYPTCQTVLRTLNETLRADEGSQKPTSMTPEHERLLAVVPLSPEDREEIQGWAFSSHDAAYLSDCLYLRDVAQSLRLPNLTPEQMADLAFAWVCRAVSLAKVPFGTELRLPPDQKRAVAAALPPSYVLRRGSGTALERMYVFLALLQQLDLDGCLIGPPNAGTVGSANGLSADGTPIPGGPARPFWAVGVRIGSDVKAYDPWREEAFPAPLRALQAKPDAHKAWFEADSNRSGVKSGDVAAAVVYLAAPVNALSVRMGFLHQKLREFVGVRLSINPDALRAAFPDPKPAFWNPSAARFAYGRTARTFLPRDLGGTDASPPEVRLFEYYKRQQVPQEIFINLPEFDVNDPTAAEHLVQMMRALYLQFFIEPPNPRERIQRGQFQDAIRDLIEKQDRLSKGVELLRNTPEVNARVRAWSTEATRLYSKLGSAVLIGDKDERAAAEAAAQLEIDKHWHDQAVALMMAVVVAPVCQAETVFELCLCKHEMAERAQVRADHAAEDAPKLAQQAREAWREALSQWNTYEGYKDVQARLPGRLDQARAMKARAEKCFKAAK